MEIRMLKEIVEKLKTLVRSEFSPIDGLCYRTADYRDPGIYSYTSDFKPLESGSVLLPGTTFIKGGIKMPDKIEKGDNFEDYLSVVIPYTEGFLLVDGEHYHGIDCNRSRIPSERVVGQTVELEILCGKRRTFVQEIGLRKSTR